MKIALIFAVMLGMCASLRAEEAVAWDDAQLGVLAAMEQLSATTAPDGSGADGYSNMLADDFARWTIGSALINHKEAWVEGVRGWFDDGWRVQDRQSRNLEIIVRGDYAFTRRIVDETYVGPDGENSGSSAALAEVWIRENGDWVLLFVNVHPLEL